MLIVPNAKMLDKIRQNKMQKANIFSELQKNIKRNVDIFILLGAHMFIT